MDRELLAWWEKLTNVFGIGSVLLGNYFEFVVDVGFAVQNPCLDVLFWYG